jgi:hypothetical protein
MHECLDGFVAIARKHQDRDDRQALMRDDLFEFISDRLVAHGYDKGREAMWSLLQHDMNLNAQGLDAWLSWLER